MKKLTPMARKKKTDISIIDNFLPEEEFKKLLGIIESPEMAWYFTPGISDDSATSEIQGNNPLDNYMFAHLLYNDFVPRSHFFDDVKDLTIPPLVERIGIAWNTLVRMKINFYQRTNEVNIHPWHVDSTGMPLLKGALLMLNTCDGYTGFADGTEVDSVANRMVLFNAHERHHSCSTSNAQRRLTLNINYV